MRRVNDKLIRAMADAIVRAVAPERIILFGSHAGGAAAPRSDVDLIVIQRGPFDRPGDRRRATARIRQALWPFRVPTDVLVYTSAEMTRWRDSVNHVLARGLREGRVLHERS